MRDKSRLLLEVALKMQSRRDPRKSPRDFAKTSLLPGFFPKSRLDIPFFRRLLAPYVLWVPISILAVACATTKKAEGPSKPTHYVLEDAPSIIATLPFPNQYPIYVKIYAGDQLLERRLAYRAWDVDHDGLIDMINYLDEKGEIIKTVYKFAGDQEVLPVPH